jgi:hypothetical protein
MEAKETDDNAMKEKKAKKKQAAQQLAAAWQSDFEADILQDKMPDHFQGMLLYPNRHYVKHLYKIVVSFAKFL